MQPVRSVKNQYRGINAHLHSFLQATGTWNRLHNAQITHLVESLRAALLPLGYVAEMEESLQIRRLDGDFSRSPRADVVIYDPEARRSNQPVASASATRLTVAEAIAEEETEHPYFAVTLRPLAPDLSMGEPVAWIELLSPANKGQTADAVVYLGKRRALLDSGLVFVELDYLHETPPTFPRVPDYSDPQAWARGAHPYRIAVLDPRPDLRSGPANIAEFDVDAPIPAVILPLAAGDMLTFDFGEPYRRMFEQGFYGY